MGILELGAALIVGSGQRLEVTATNIANSTTPGYKAQELFSAFLRSGDPAGVEDVVSTRTRLDAGSYRQTNNGSDLAVQGEGYFVLSNAGETVYSRAGQFHRDADGRLVNAGGLAVQSSGGDITLRSDSFRVLGDGTVLDGEEPVARLDIVQFVDASTAERVGASFRSDPANVMPVDNVRIASGMIEESNVSMAHEFLAMMQAQRTAETGRHLVQTYDDLLGRALTTFGQS